MTIDGRKIPDDWLVRLEITAYCQYWELRHSDLRVTLLKDFHETECGDYFLQFIDEVKCEVYTLPDCNSDKKDHGEYLGGFKLDIAKDSPPLDPSLVEGFTGALATYETNKTHIADPIKAAMLDSIKLEKDNILLGGNTLEVNSFELDEYYSDGPDKIIWYVNGKETSIFFDQEPTCLLSQLIHEMDYIIFHTELNICKSADFIESFGDGLPGLLLEMVANMDKEKRRAIMCNQNFLEHTLSQKNFQRSFRPYITFENQYFFYSDKNLKC